MAKDAVYARVDPDLKSKAEEILSMLGLSPSELIKMLYSQVVLTRGVPFEIRLPYEMPESLSSMTRDELDAGLRKGMESIKSGDVYTADEVDAEMARMAMEFGI